MNFTDTDIAALAAVVGSIDDRILRTATHAWAGSADVDAAFSRSQDDLARHYAEAHRVARDYGFAAARLRGDHVVVGFVPRDDEPLPRGFRLDEAGMAVADRRTRQGRTAHDWAAAHAARRAEVVERDQDALGIRGHHFFTVTEPRFMFGTVRPTIVRAPDGRRPLAYVANLADITGIEMDPDKWTPLKPELLRAVAGDVTTD